MKSLEFWFENFDLSSMIFEEHPFEDVFDEQTGIEKVLFEVVEEEAKEHDEVDHEDDQLIDHRCRFELDLAISEEGQFVVPIDSSVPNVGSPGWVLQSRSIVQDMSAYVQGKGIPIVVQGQMWQIL